VIDRGPNAEREIVTAARLANDILIASPAALPH